jgi:hypothetical protein
MNPAALFMGLSTAALAGAGGYLLLRKRGDSVILYAGTAPEPGHVATFRNAANAAARQVGGTPAPVYDGQTLLAAIRRYRRIKTLLLIGHGTSTAFIRPGTSGLRLGSSALPTWVGVQDFARELAPRLASGWWLGLLGCRAAAMSDEPDWSAVTAQAGGARSLAGLLRDALVAAGAPYGRVGGHTTTGSTTENPRVREFSTRTPGAPGTVTPGVTQGAIAMRWAFTGGIA